MEIPEEAYRHKNSETKIMEEQDTYTPVEWVAIKEGGIYLQLKGAEYPQQSLASPRAISDINIAKRLLLEQVKLFSRWWFLPTSLLLFVVPYKYKLRIIENIIVSYNRICIKFMKNHILKEELMTSFGREFEWLVYNFMNNLGIKPKEAEIFSEIVATIVDLDMAYRLRGRDVFEEVNKEKLYKSPIKEVRKLCKIYREREYKYPTMRKKIIALEVLIVGILIFPKFRKVFKKTINETKIHNLKYDEIDKYWSCLRTDYNFLGMEYEERKKQLEGCSIPVLIKRE